MLCTRGAVLALGAACGAIAGLVYGVEEFVYLALAVAVLLVLGTVSAWYRQHVSRRALRVVVKIPQAEVSARQPASVELTVTNAGRRRLPPVLVEEARGHWTVSHPGLGDSSTAHAARGGSAQPRRGRAPERPVVAGGFSSLGDRASSDGWLGGPGTRPDRRERARARRIVAGAQQLPDLGPGEEAVVSVRVPTDVRGLLTLDDLGLWCGDPFGLVVRRITLAPPAHVVVYPVPVAVTRRPPGTRPVGREHPPTMGSRDGLSGDELSGLRPYAPGDRLTRLHWPSLARTGELVVREFLEPRAGSLALLVDLRPSAHEGDTFESTISPRRGVRALRLGPGADRGAVHECG